MAKNKRQYVDERTTFTIEEKALMLQKSKGKCAHCGHELQPYEVSAEHIVPLSQGGTNDNDNLVALCSTCNFEKQNLVYHPKHYYPYLGKQYVKKATKYFEQYITDFNWFTHYNFMQSDNCEFVYPLMLPGRRMVQGTAMVRKMNANPYTDNKERISAWLEGWYGTREFNAERPSLEEIEAYVEDVTSNGAFYYVGDLDNPAFLLPVRLRSVDDGRHTEHYALCFGPAFCSVDSPLVGAQLAYAMDAIVRQVGELASKCGVNKMLVYFIMRICDIYSHLYTYINFELKKNIKWFDGADMRRMHNGFVERYRVTNKVDYIKSDSYMYMDKAFNINPRYEDAFGDDKNLERYILREELNKWDRFVQKYCGNFNILSLDISDMQDIELINHIIMSEPRIRINS